MWLALRVASATSVRNTGRGKSETPAPIFGVNMWTRGAANGLLPLETSAYLLRLIFPNYPELTPCHALPEEVKRAID